MLIFLQSLIRLNVKKLISILNNNMTLELKKFDMKSISFKPDENKVLLLF